MSLIGGTTKGDSNSFDGGETGITGEERRSDGALFSDAPTEIRTPVLGLKGLRPSPLDDGGVHNGENSIILPVWGQEWTFLLKRRK
jgi:hypothetical protein